MWCYNTKNWKGVVIITKLNKNGKIEFVRFIFSLEIMFFHIFDLLDQSKDLRIENLLSVVDIEACSAGIGDAHAA